MRRPEEDPGRLPPSARGSHPQKTRTDPDLRRIRSFPPRRVPERPSAITSGGFLVPRQTTRIPSSVVGSLLSRRLK